MNQQQHQPMATDAGQQQENQVHTEPTLAAWRKWLEGSFHTMLQATQLQKQLQEWGVSMEEDLTEQAIPLGVVVVLNTRTGGLASTMDQKASHMALGSLELTYNAKGCNQISPKANSSKWQLQKQYTHHCKIG